MIKAFWLLLKISLFVLFIVWVADLPGDIKIDAFDYLVSIDLGFFLIGVGFTFIVFLCIYNLIAFIIHLPARYKKYRETRNREKGYKSLTLGLTAVAAGDKKVALQQADRTSKYLKNDTGLPVLLRAQAARINGQEEVALKSFLLLLENKDAAFLGMRGLLQTALDRDYHDKALNLAQQALAFHPKQPWILKLVYDLQLKEKRWDDALQSLKALKKIKALPKDKIQRDQSALFIAKATVSAESENSGEELSFLEKAFHNDKSFLPAAHALARAYIERGHNKKAQSVLEKSWKHTPHPESADLWRSLMPQKKDNDTARNHMDWFLKLHKANIKSEYSFIEAARTAFQVKLYDDARDYLKKSTELSPTQEAYQLMIELERKPGQRTYSEEHWLDKAEKAAPARSWICAITSQHYDNWHLVTPSHGGFNTLYWGGLDPDKHTIKTTKHILKKNMLEGPDQLHL